VTADIFDAIDLQGSEWKLSAVCASVDPSLWFPEVGPPSNKAKELCGLCPVQVECLDYALEQEAGESFLWGLYGGKTPTERWKILAARQETERYVKAAPDGVTRARVFTALMELADSDGIVSVSTKVVGEMCGVSRNAANEHIHRLVNDGALEVVSGSAGAPLVYRIADQEAAA
jgi:WhiB family redox-sensing transcriptional regulator